MSQFKSRLLNELFVKSYIDYRVVLLISVLFLSELVVGLNVPVLATTSDSTSTRIAQQPEASLQEANRTDAKRVFDEADKLREQGTAESFKQAIGKYEEALRLYRAVSDLFGETVTLNNIGRVYYSLGEKQKALEYYNQALPLMRAVGYRGGGGTRGGRDRSGEAFTLILTGIGLVYDSLGEKEKALEYYNQVLPLMRESNNLGGEAQTLNNIALIYDSLGEKQKTLDYFNQALPLWRQLKDLSGEAFSLNSIGVVYDSLGEKQKALEYYNQALPLARAAGDRSKEAITLNNIGLVYNFLGEKQKALEYLNQSLPLRRTARDRAGEAQTLNNIGLVYDSLGEKQKALNHYKEVLLIWREVKSLSGEALTLNNIGLLYDDLGQKEKALECLKGALPLWRAVGHRSGEALTLNNIAFLERERGNLQEALTQIEASLKIIESLRTKVASQQLRTSYLASVQNYYQFYIDLLMQLHKQNPSKGYDAKALEASERAKARSLLEILTEAHADIRSGVDPKLVEQERTSQQQINAKEQRWVQLLSGAHTEAEAAGLQKEIEALLNQYEEVQAQIRVKSPRYAALTQPQPLTLQQIQSTLLDDNTLLLEYSLGKERSYLWAVSKNSINSYELPPQAEIETAVRHFEKEGLVQGIRPKRAAQAANALSQILLSPVAEKLNNKRLVIVADGILQSLPFSALAVPNSSQQDTVFVPLIVEHEIVNLPSASTLAVLRRDFSGRKVAPKAIAIFADPVFSKDDQRVSGVPTPASSSIVASSENVPITQAQLERSTRESGVTLKRLPGTRIEAEAIMAMVPESQRTQFFDFKVTKNTATSPDLSQYQILHFATHGILNTTTPELSGVVMSLVDEKGIPQNGFLRLNDIFNLNLPAELVVLSACETGQGKEVKGEGIIGLTRGFMYAGAPRVVVSLWSVDDTATAELMKRFYQKILQEKLTPSAALRQAQIEMSQIPQWSNPYYWAAFTLHGEWK